MSNGIAGPDILSERIFTVADASGGFQRLSLAGLLAQLLTDPEVASFPRLAAEQRGHWWRFLVRCAAKALHSRGWSVQDIADVKREALEGAIRDGLRSAADDPDGSRGVWALHQPDPTQPGFLQPPTPDGKRLCDAGYGLKPISFLTSAIGEKEHERKSRIPNALTDEDVAYALVEYQMASIYRLQHGYESQLTGSRDGAGSSTPFMGARIGSENESFRHDISVFLNNWDRIRGEHGLRGTVWALWTEHWGGSDQLTSDKLDPAFVPLARLVRLAEAESGLHRSIWFRPTWKGGRPRVRDLLGGGNFGDTLVPMVPDADDPALSKIRGTLKGGYGYTEVANLLFGVDPKRPGIASPSVREAHKALYNERPDVRVLFEGTAFEQGKTVGFYSRELLLPISAASWLSETRQPIREVHGEMLQKVGLAKWALNGAARILLSGEPKPRKGDTRKIAPPADLFENMVDRDYLAWLLSAAGCKVQGDETWRFGWTRHLEALALRSFTDTRESVPSTIAQRFQRRVRAQHWLKCRLRQLRADAGDPDATSDTSEPEETAA